MVATQSPPPFVSAVMRLNRTIYASEAPPVPSTISHNFLSYSCKSSNIYSNSYKQVQKALCNLVLPIKHKNSSGAYYDFNSSPPRILFVTSVCFQCEKNAYNILPGVCLLKRQNTAYDPEQLLLVFSW